MKPLIACIGLLAIVVPNFAFAFCVEPTAPYCVNSFGSFSDEWEFKRCRSDMESYASDVDDFSSCIQRELKDEIQNLVDEAQRKASRVQDELSNAVNDFNGRASR